MAWADSNIRKMVINNFIPAADEVDKLRRGDDRASKLFRSIAQNSFSNLRTTQGTYIVSAGGELLNFGNVIEPDKMKSFLSEGLKKFKELTRVKRRGKARRDNTEKSSYPDKGLVLGVTLRKLYTRKPASRREKRGVVEWNVDFAWFKKAEARQFLPRKIKTGAQGLVPTPLVERLVRLHFTDTVRAFADVYPKECLIDAKLTTTVQGVEGALISLRFDGLAKTQQDDAVSYGRLKRKAKRGYDAKLLGFARYDLKKQRFVAFDLIALGTNHGGGLRASSEDPVQMGILLELAPRSPAYRVEPNHLGSYDW